MEDLLDMTFQLGRRGAPADWDEVLHNIWMCSARTKASPDACAAAGIEHDERRTALELDNRAVTYTEPREGLHDQDLQESEILPLCDPLENVERTFLTNLWEDEKWVKELSRPDTNFSARDALPSYLHAIRLPEASRRQALEALLTLNEGTMEELQLFYQRQQASSR